MSLNMWLNDNLAPDKLRLPDKKKSDTILLEEKDENVNMAVRIVGVPHAVAPIRLDEVGHLSAFARKGLNYICDYLIVAQRNDIYYAIFVELKKTLKGNTRHREQLRRALPLLRYLVSVFELDTGSKLPESKIVTQYFLIGQQSSPKWDKQNVKYDPATVFETEEYRSITVRTGVARTIPFSELLKH